jgi:hypothetical protein
LRKPTSKIPSTKKGGMPAFEPTAEQRELVEKVAGFVLMLRWHASHNLYPGTVYSPDSARTYAACP